MPTNQHTTACRLATRRTRDRAGGNMLGFSRNTLEPVVREAVEAVKDPELGRGIGELGMLRSVAVDRSGDLTITIALTTAACPMKQQLTRDVSAAVAAVAPMTRAVVAFTTMDEDQRRA